MPHLLLLRQICTTLQKTSRHAQTSFPRIGQLLGKGLQVSSLGLGARSFATMSLLEHAQDHYGGVIIHAEGLPDDAEAFDESLKHSMKEWKSQGKRGVWLKIPLNKSSLLPKAAAHGFEYHHAQHDYAMLTKWLPTTPSTIPENLLYNVGVGAFVVNSKNEMLLVKEASGVTKGMNIWKMVTGLVDRGENVPEAVAREVMEETGLSVKFDRVLIIRQSHGLLFGRSDIFFVCACKLTGQGEEIRVQESELEAASWIPMNEAAEMPIFRTGPFKIIMEACQGYADGSVAGFKAEALVNDFTKRQELIIHPAQ